MLQTTTNGAQQRPKITLDQTRNPSHLLLLLVLLFIGLLYSNTLNSPPVLDDLATFVNNPSVYIDDLSFASLKQIYEGPFGHNRFLPMLSFAIDQLLSHGRIIQFHLTNILIHILATIAVYALLQGLTNTIIGKKALSFITPGHFSLMVATLWALHPVQTSGVTYLVQRMASMAALFYFSALAGYIWARIGKTWLAKATGWGAFVVFMLCAFLSKENTATLPLAALMIEMVFISPDLGRKILARIRRRHWLLLAIILLLILPLATTKLAAIANSYSFRPFNLPERLFTELRVVVFYLSLLALPLPGRFNLDHDFPISHTLWQPSATMLSLLLLTFLFFAAIRYHRQHPLAAFGILFFFLNLLIESTIFPLELVFEHRLYLPSLGFFIAIVSLFDWFGRFIQVPNRKEQKTIFYLGILILACTLAIGTTLRNHVWRDKLTFWQDIALKSPQKPRVATNLGRELLKAARYEEAQFSLEKAISLGNGQSEEYFKAATNIVAIYTFQEKFQEAADWAEKLIKDQPQARLNHDGFPLLMMSLAASYWQLEKFTSSLEAFSIGLTTHHRHDTPILLGGMEAMLLDAATKEEGRRQLDLSKDPAEIYSRMAGALLMNKDYKNAATYLTKALTLAPTNDTSLAIQKIWEDETGRNQRARMAISSANQPAASTGIRFKAALSLAGFFETKYTALDHLVGPLLKKAVQLEPESISAALRLAQWQLQNNEVDEAVKLAERHLSTNPDLAPLLELAAKGYFVQGKNDLAAAMLERLLEVYPATRGWKRYRKFILAYRGEV